MSWSPQQQQAISSRNQNLLVAAAAGSRKTSVLVERIIQRLLDTDKQQAIDINQLLVVTFTKGAAAEMRGRIQNLLGVPIGGAWVGTFHGLAHRLLPHHHFWYTRWPIRTAYSHTAHPLRHQCVHLLDRSGRL